MGGPGPDRIAAVRRSLRQFARGVRSDSCARPFCPEDSSILSGVQTTCGPEGCPHHRFSAAHLPRIFPSHAAGTNTPPTPDESHAAHNPCPDLDPDPTPTPSKPKHLLPPRAPERAPLPLRPRGGSPALCVPRSLKPNHPQAPKPIPTLQTKQKRRRHPARAPQARNWVGVSGNHVKISAHEDGGYLRFHA